MERSQGGPSEPLDMAMVQEMREDDDMGYDELVEIFLEEADLLLAGLREAVAEGDLDAGLRSVHTLKSSGATVGAMTLSAICSRLEAQARANTLPSEEEVDAVSSELERVRVALEGIIGS